MTEVASKKRVTVILRNVPLEELELIAEVMNKYREAHKIERKEKASFLKN